MCAHVYDVAFCGNTVRNVALRLWLVGNPVIDELECTQKIRILPGPKKKRRYRTYNYKISELLLEPNNVGELSLEKKSLLANSTGFTEKWNEFYWSHFIKCWNQQNIFGHSNKT